MLFALWMWTKIMFEDGWCAIPNAFNWCVEHTFGRRRRSRKAGIEAEELAQRIAWLESCSRQWTELRMQGRDVLWHDTFGWIADADVCPCGYVTECAIWCGDGHQGAWTFATDGTGWHYQKGQCDHDREAVIRPLLWDVEGAGGKYER
jgi:hypothetical protein